MLDREHVDPVVLDVMMPKPDFSPAKPEQADEPPKGAPPAFCFSRRGGGALRGHGTGAAANGKTGAKSGSPCRKASRFHVRGRG